MLLQHIEDMRVHLSEVARDEQALVQALGDALNRLDQQLLGGVRTIAMEHELRREGIFGELQDLADGIGMLRQPLGAPKRRRSFHPTAAPTDSMSASSLWATGAISPNPTGPFAKSSTPATFQAAALARMIAQGEKLLVQDCLTLGNWQVLGE